MAIIRCTASADGKLAPVAVEFEPGDFVEFPSSDFTVEASVALEVRGMFTLDNLSTDQDNLMIRLDRAGSATPARTLRIRPDPKLPPPPVEDGANVRPIKLVIETRSTGATLPATTAVPTTE
jgi:hypothetical protein